MNRTTPLAAIIVTFASLVTIGCSTTRSLYYDTWEKFGYAKRERLVDNVKEARDAQAAAKQQFTSALEQFKSVVNFEGGDLEAMYNKLNKEYERSEDRAEAVNEKITGVKRVAGALFEEWKGEIKEMQDASLRRQSQELLDKTQDSYGEMIARMDAAAATMQPVLGSFRDRVLFIKHNLNAQAIASLKGTEAELGEEIQKLIREMERSIAEADEFIAELQPPKG
jgi:hypothetical protein